MTPAKKLTKIFDEMGWTDDYGAPPNGMRPAVAAQWVALLLNMTSDHGVLLCSKCVCAVGADECGDEAPEERVCDKCSAES